MKSEKFNFLKREKREDTFRSNFIVSEYLILTLLYGSGFDPKKLNLRAHQELRNCMFFIHSDSYHRSYILKSFFNDKMSKKI